RYLNFLCQTGVNKLLRATLGKDLHQRFHGSQVTDMSDISQIFLRQLLLPQGTPAPAKAAVSVKKRLRESAMLPQRLPIGGRHLGWRLNFLGGQACPQTLAHA